MEAVFTGFDSAWGTVKSGAICNLALMDDGSLWLTDDPVAADWDRALVHARQEMSAALRVWAIDQPLVVPNRIGCRPVERDLAKALMAEFGCGAHSSNLGLPAWAAGAPIWSFQSSLEDNGYFQNPMAIPGAAGGRFYFECYPHPALLGLFDLGRIVKYKGGGEEWRRLLRLVRSLTAAELPIRNICGFVQEDLKQSKTNEDKLDSIICAYVAAYWWRFGVERSTVIGDLSTGYMVTPHSVRTLAALARVFGDRMNRRGTVSPPERRQVPRDQQQPEPKPEPPALSPKLPRCDWVYFATTSRWSGTVTRDFVSKHHLIVRSVYNSAGQRIANVQHLSPGDRILLVHGGKGKPYRALFSATIARSAMPVHTSEHCFGVFSYIDASLEEELKAGGYTPDAVVQRFTGISITAVQDLRHVGTAIPRRLGNSTISPWDDVFGR